MEKDFTIKPEPPLFPPVISERKLTELKNDYPILYEFSELFDNGITPESFIKDKAAKCEYGEAAFFDLLKHEIGLLKHEIEFIKYIIESEGGTYIEYGTPLTFEEEIKGTNCTEADIFYNLYVLGIEKIVSEHFATTPATPTISKAPQRFTREFSSTEQKKLFNGLKDGGFIAENTNYYHFCAVFGNTPIPEKEKPFTRLVWAATNKKAKNKANKKSLLDLLKILEIPEPEIKNKPLINSLFTFQNAKPLSPQNYTLITDTKKCLKEIKSEYHTELLNIVDNIIGIKRNTPPKKNTLRDNFQSVSI
mgnify:FL=1